MSILDSVTKKKKATVAKDTVVDSSSKTKKSESKEVVTDVASHVLIAPVISEKAVMAETDGIYTFRVTLNATKVMIAHEMKRVYSVTPVSVRVVNVEGKIKRFGRSSGRRASWKKAIISLPKGTSIAIHSGV
jgi:large subunit ribosomal protein L23